MTKEMTEFEQIEARLHEAIAWAKGENVEARVHIGVDVPAIRAKTGLTQEEFANRLMVSIKTIRNWEQGRRVPDGAARALLRAVDRGPAVVMGLLAGA